MHNYLKIGIALAIAATAYLTSIAGYQWSKTNAYHGEGELNFFRGNNIGLPLADNGIFKASGNCDGCHGYDETQQANVNNQGHDISPITMWRGSMMANSAKDPLWKAKVSHEVAVNPSHQEALEDKCTSCHAPMGRYSHDILGSGSYGMDDLATDSLGMDGVSCLACHKQSDEELGLLNSGDLNFTLQPVAYGPFGKPFEPPMQDLVGVLPVASSHIQDAGICAGCHTLLTNSVDLDGNFTGETFVEQATYHEWLNSAYDDGQPLASTCQDCHMPEDDAEVILSSNYSELFPRSPYSRHELVGGNTFMLKLMKDNGTTIDLNASDEVMDSTIARSTRMLQNQTLDLDLTFGTFTNDTAIFHVRLENLAGHKFPSGYPSRRAFIEFLALQQNGDTLFQSGLMQPDYTIAGQNADYEPHYNVINSESQAQIYEMVMGDVNNDVTTVLERAYQMIKDNRLTPIGFTTSHAVYDTTQIVGNALTDEDFNFDGFEGSGTDAVHYHVPLNGYNGTLKVVARMQYQAVPPRYLTEMFQYSTPEIDAFEAMYNAADKSPVLVAADSITNISVITGKEEVELADLNVYPNPTTNGLIRISGSDAKKIQLVRIYAINGKLISESSVSTGKSIQLPKETGVYLVQVSGEFGTVVKRVYRN